MKKLVLGALLLSFAAATGCVATTEPTDAVITARWSFTHFSNGQARSCPVDFPKAVIYSQVWDPFSHRLTGTTVRDVFDCNAPGMVGTTDPLDGIFLVWVQIEGASPTQIYAQSESAYIDTADGDVSLDLPIYDDAGYFFLSWDLVDSVTQKALTCKEAGVTGNAGVETVATLAGPNTVVTDTFNCEHHFGTTDPLLAGRYTVSVDALVNGQSVGTAPTLINKQVTSPNGLTDLGNIIIPID